MVGGEHVGANTVVGHGFGHKDATLYVDRVVCINIVIPLRPTEIQTI